MGCLLLSSVLVFLFASEMSPSPEFAWVKRLVIQNLPLNSLLLPALGVSQVFGGVKLAGAQGILKVFYFQEGAS
jgi:hypothetical protein